MFLESECVRVQHVQHINKQSSPNQHSSCLGYMTIPGEWKKWILSQNPISTILTNKRSNKIVLDGTIAYNYAKTCT